MSVITAGKTAKSSRKDPWYVRAVLIAITVAFLGFMVIGPIVNVFGRGFEQGWDVFIAALPNKHTAHALGVTLLIAASSSSSTSRSESRRPGPSLGSTSAARPS